jgi:hypothetical protein
MSKFRPAWLLVPIALILAGCSVQSSQLNAVLGMFDKASAPFDENSWVVEFADYSATVYPVTVDQGTLFSNQLGDVILFDGWAVREVSGLGRRLKRRVVDNDAARRYMYGNRFVAQHQCDAWQSEQQSGMIRYRQVCWGRSQYTNMIQVNAAGQISLVRQIIDGSDQYLTLRKKSKTTRD